MPPAALIFAGLCVLAYAHFRWADIDPHNPAARSGRLWCAVKSTVSVVLLLVALDLVKQGAEWGGSIVGSFAVGLVAGPAVTTPTHLRQDEETSAVARYLEVWRNALSGGLMKTVLVLLLSYPVAYLIEVQPSYWVLAIMACILSFAKFPVALLLSQSSPAMELNYERAGLTGRVSVIALTGCIALAFWFPLAFPLVEPVPPASASNYLAAIALWLGLASGEAISG